ncbi:hypothetical protein CC1G_01593 [Coprinopsis cinerea okayama7|uniref:Major facilitator superfamily domain-containing protein n=1 Tax=Coprinopsis cinerea (strain Okayama-7 / 130 / ATCC MYA-4618 / FGSC 9003) TaxID=240176 RepID=A8NI61_COPC7|nr:hypothetical protein CC1G_01593 [Coprinopsis cinerea okayama7\|eukprot:XP_001833916.2 hypothetical protein CC1G_01593 [Coprinopsis cinerea okayama7\
MLGVKAIWRSYTHYEKRNIAFYIGGIMCYKFGIEFFNGSIITLAADRFETEHAFTKLGAAKGLNQAAQCIGAILIAPLIKRWPTRTVLAFSIFAFALMTALLLIIDAATDGEFKDPITKETQYGTWPVDLIFLIWTLSGVGKLIKPHLSPVDIVGGKAHKLRPMDATVHIFYEIAGTGGAFASSSAISRFGNNYSFFMTPVFFTFAGAIWLFISTLSFKRQNAIDGELNQTGLSKVSQSNGRSEGYFKQVIRGATGFGESVWIGGKLLFTNRRFFWLLPSYSIALYCHRYLESALGTAFATRVLETSAWSQIMVGGSNFGELLGAVAVLLLSNIVTTPVPWLRFDALALNLVWLLPYFSRMAQPRDVKWAWAVAGCFFPISMGWAAGDVSLAAYIQSALTEANFVHPRVSALGAVMAFLYSSYIIFYAVLSSVLGGVLDRDFQDNGTITRSLLTIGGIQFSVASVIILASTFVPVGSFAFNPKALGHIKNPDASHPHSPGMIELHSQVEDEVESVKGVGGSQGRHGARAGEP